MESPLSPFQKIDLENNANNTIKLLLWGESGAGKTTIALQAPKPIAIIDMEGGSKLYSKKYDFSLFSTSDITEVKRAIFFLMKEKHDFKTLIIDPITIYWDELQRYWSKIFITRNEGSSGNKHEFYDLGPKEWKTIKSDFEALITRLVNLDMNVIVTAHQATKYKEGSFMKKEGVRFDADAKLEYFFDTVVQLYRGENSEYLAKCTKDRNEILDQKKDFESIEILKLFKQE